MIHINEGQAQLSGWGYSAEPKALFIDKVPEPFMVGQTISAAATREPGGTELHFTDGTILYFRRGYGLFPALDNVTVWTVPAEGTTVSNTLEYVEIHASYTTKSGKVIQAIPAKVPVAVPKFLRVIVPEEPLIDEGYHLKVAKAWTDSDTQRGINTVVFRNKAYLVVDWADKQDVIFRTTRCENANVMIDNVNFSNLGFNGGTLQVVSRNTSRTFTRYRTPEDEGEEMTIADGGTVRFKYRINNTNLFCETGVEVNAIIDEGLFNLRKSYAGTTEYTVDVNKNARAIYRNGKVLIGRYHNGNNFFIPFYLYTYDWMGWMIRRETQTITLKNGEDKNLNNYMRERFGSGNTFWWAYRNYHYKCEDGEVDWDEGDLHYTT